MSKQRFVEKNMNSRTTNDHIFGANHTKTDSNTKGVSTSNQNYLNFISNGPFLDRLDDIVHTKKCEANYSEIDSRAKEASSIYQDKKMKCSDSKSNILRVNKRRKINDFNEPVTAKTCGKIWIRKVPVSRRVNTGMGWKSSKSDSNQENDQIQVHKTSFSPSSALAFSFEERRVGGMLSHNIVSPDGVASISNPQISNSRSSPSPSYFSLNNDRKLSRQDNIFRYQAKCRRSYIMPKEWHDRQYKSDDSTFNESTCEKSAYPDGLACDESTIDSNSNFNDSSCVKSTTRKESPCNNLTSEQEQNSVSSQCVCELTSSPRFGVIVVETPMVQSSMNREDENRLAESCEGSHDNNSSFNKSISDESFYTAIQPTRG